MTYVPHEVFQSTGGEKTYREGGIRLLKSRSLQVGGCSTSFNAPTGTAQGTNTALTIGAGMQCLAVRTDSDRWVLDEYVGIVLQAKGWLFQPLELVIRGLRAPLGSLVVFGMRGTEETVRPKLQTYSGTVLRTSATEYDVAGNGPKSVPGVTNYGGSRSCNGENWRACAVIVEFQEPIDTLVILFASEASSVMVGPVYSKCGCRCKLVHEESEHMAPLVGQPGLCWKSQSSLQYHKCSQTNSEGIDWCAVESRVQYSADLEGNESTGGASGDKSQGDAKDLSTVKCSPEEREFAVYEQPFGANLAERPQWTWM